MFNNNYDKYKLFFAFFWLLLQMGNKKIVNVNDQITKSKAGDGVEPMADYIFWLTLEEKG